MRRRVDAEEQARRKRIEDITERLNALLPKVLQDTGVTSQFSLHGLFGGKFADYIDIRNEVITSPEHFVSLYLHGFKTWAEAAPGSNHAENFRLLGQSRRLQKYLYLFLKRVYLRNYAALSKKRPRVEEAEWWLGHNKASFGIFVTPRFNQRLGQWENDKSEIRHFRHPYWSIAHVLETGLVVPGANRRIRFSGVDDFLVFFQDVLVRGAGSQYQNAIATLYCKHVRAARDPLNLQLLMPELRYGGLNAKHDYRLDFSVIDPADLYKVGFELSPWSSHGRLAGTARKSQAEINAEARANRERELRKVKAYFRQYGIFTSIFTDEDLADPPKVFREIEKYLRPRQIAQQLEYHIIDEILGP